MNMTDLLAVLRSLSQWQRVAISRAFMRAKEADLLLLDEPTSHLDAHAQNNVLKAVDQICRDPTTGKRSKTVIIITHQLSIARRADKIAMFENGVRLFRIRGLNVRLNGMSF